VADSGAHLDGIALDPHAPAPAMSELASCQLAVDALAVELEPGGQALDDRHEPGPVRLARGGEAKSGHGAA
jgi:hypothetical protein